jgi:hypothetical protein
MTEDQAYDLGYKDAYWCREWNAPEDDVRHAYADGWNQGILDFDADDARFVFAELLEGQV